MRVLSVCKKEKGKKGPLSLFFFALSLNPSFSFFPFSLFLSHSVGSPLFFRIIGHELSVLLQRENRKNEVKKQLLRKRKREKRKENKSKP